MGTRKVSLANMKNTEGYSHQYNNNVHFEGVRFICGPHPAIIGQGEARADLMAR